MVGKRFTVFSFHTVRSLTHVCVCIPIVPTRTIVYLHYLGIKLYLNVL